MIGRKTTPIRDKIHWFIGRTLVTAALVNIITGLILYSELFDINVALWGALLGIWVVGVILVCGSMK